MRAVLVSSALALAATLTGCGSLPLWMITQQRSTITDHQHFTNAPIPAAHRPSPLPVATPPLALPALTSSETMEQLMERQGTVALLILRDGRVVYERYFNGRERDTLLTSFSMAKSVVALLLGQAIRDGHVRSVDDPVTRYLPELAQQDARFAQIRLRDLLAMRSGIAFEETYSRPWSEVAVFYLTPNLARAVAGLRIAEPPDQRFHYSSGDTQLLGMAIERATGRRLHQLVTDGLWQPMGAEMDASWSLDSALQGQAKAFCCLNARAIDYARLGQLMLQHGRVDGRQLVPESWIDAVLQVREHPGETADARRNIESPDQPDAAFYTWQWRRMPQGSLLATPPADAAQPAERLVPGTDFYAQGQHGQYIYVAPQQRTVVVRLGTDRRPGLWWPGLLGQLARVGTDAPASVAALSAP